MPDQKKPLEPMPRMATEKPAESVPPEVIGAPEAEMTPEAEKPAQKESPTEAEVSLGKPASAPPLTLALPEPVPKDALTTQIEKILEENLYDLYRELPEKKQQKFKQKGEEVTQKIRVMIAGAKVRLRKLFKMILDWLKMLPKTNKYYLQQEAKIKADKILRIVKEK